MRKEFRGPKWNPKYKKNNFYFNPKVAPTEAISCKNHQNPSDRKSHTWAPLKPVSVYVYFLTQTQTRKIKNTYVL